MLKKIFCVLITLIILIPLCAIPASADSDVTTGSSTSGTDVNLWTYKMWEEYYGEVDVTTRDFDFIREITDYDYNFISIDTANKQSNGYYIASYYLKGDEISYELTDTLSGFLASDTEFTANRRYFNNSSVSNDLTVYYNNSLYDGYSINFGMYYSESINLVNNYYVWLVSDLNIYNSFVKAFPDFADQIYYCSDPTKSFLDYIDSLKYDDMFYDVYPLKDGYQNIIRFYDCWDSFYGKYTYDFYTDNMLNYLNSSYCIDSPIYFQGKGIDTGHQLDGAELQHNEIVHIYIPVPDDFSVTNANDYLTSIGTAVHYEKGPMDFSTWYNDYIVPWCKQFPINSEYKLITLKNVEPSTFDKPTVNTSDKKKDVNLLRIAFPSAYTFIESTSSEGGFLMSGCRTMSTALKVDISNGSVDNTAKDGIGSDIDGGDYSDDKDADELLADGWKNGYPNKSSYPYKITVNKNGYVLYEIFFDKKPKIKSNFYSDSQLAYDVDFNYTRGYVYAKQQNCYIDFDFRSQTEDDLMSSDGTLSDSITDEISEFQAKQAIAFSRIFDCLVNGVSYIVSGEPSEKDYSKYITEKVVRLWTNYTGQLTGAYRGYYVQFNWDLESDKDFIKNNSDDDHNYSEDFLDDGDGFVDNNGNTHGGAVELPTDGDVVNGFNNEDFSFDENSLWDYADSFLGFCARAFKVLPAFCWQLIACSIVIIIMLRILGR